MQTSCYLIVTGHVRRMGYGRHVVDTGPIDIRKNKPKLAADQIAVRINLNIPDALFIKPALEVSLRLPEPETSLELTPEVQERISEAIRDAAGVTAHVSFSAPEAE
jgi:hypothetical protein